MPDRATNYSTVWWVLGVIVVAVLAWVIIGATGVGSTLPSIPNTGINGTDTTGTSGSGSNTNTNGY